MKFKIGDRARCKPGGIEIWVHAGKIYEVLGIETEPAKPRNECYRNCGHPMHDQQPEKYFIVVNGELGKRAIILEDCFDSVCSDDIDRV